MEKTKSKRRMGMAFWGIGILLLFLGVFLFTKTLGTALLFTSVLLGKISRYAWIFALTGVLASCVGTIYLKKYPAVKKKEKAKAEAKEEAAKEETEMKEEVQADAEKVKEEAKEGQPVSCFCPQCGKELKPESKFCAACGARVAQ